MLYILPPLRSQNPPPPWAGGGLVCVDNGNGGGTAAAGADDNGAWRRPARPPRLRLRDLQVVPFKPEDESNGIEDDMDTNRNPKSLSECYFAGKGAALVLSAAEARGVARRDDEEEAPEAAAPGGGGGGGGSRFGAPAAAGANSAIQRHLQSMFYLLRPEETLKMAVKLESVHPNRTRYLVVVSRMGHRAEESCLLGIDCNERTTVGLVLKVLANTKITLDGDGGFSVSVSDRHHIFKPVSVQAMWSALQTLHKVSAKAREGNYFDSSSRMTHGWAEYYEARVESDRSCLNEWHAMDDLESRRPPSPDSIRTKPTEREETERVIRTTLKEIMMSVDLDEVTSKVIRSRLEEELDMDLGEFKSFIDQEMLTILGQMDAPTRIFDHVYLGSEWNASNYEELERNGVGHILNVTREIDNFFPGTFDYLNIRVYDDEKTDLLKYWDDTFKYITKARDKGSKVLVHCKMGVSRSASVVIAYAMKAYNWDFHKALGHVKDKRSCIKPNTSFLNQLEMYQGILDAMKNKEKLQRSKSETNLKSPTNGNKTDKVLPGSEPTPVVQALSKSFNSQSTMSGQDLRQMGTRPKSWSPDNLCGGVKSSPMSMSLEDLSQKSSSKESVKSVQYSQDAKSSLARHVLMPCDNGESYSVSPNQIVHLPGHDSCANQVENKQIVLNLASKFESAPKTNVSDDGSSRLSGPGENDNANSKVGSIKEETWDPGENQTRKNECSSCDSTSDACDLKTSLSESQTVWTSSAVIKSQTSVHVNNNCSLGKVPESRLKTFPPRKDGDFFSNQCDRVFDREEKKQQRMSTIPVISSGCIPELSNDDKVPRECPSRQSSWSSYDSAVAFPENTELSRHSSWGSGDTRTLPSRNSSWGSYDMRPRASVYYNNEKGEKTLHPSSGIFENNSSGIFPYDKEEIPWHPGTVRRTKQKIENNRNARNCSGSDSMTSSCVSLVTTPSSETIHFDFVAEQLRPVDAVNTTLVDSYKTAKEDVSSAISDKIDIPVEDRKVPPDVSRLSASAPESSSMQLVGQDCSLSRSTSNISSKDNSSLVISTSQCPSVKQHRTFLENLHRDAQNSSRKMEDSSDSAGGNLGKVKNLKKEFEAKSSTNPDITSTNGELNDNSRIAKVRVSSLPSSPVSVHQNREERPAADDSTIKNIIGKFENNKEETPQVNLRHCTNKPFTPNRNTRYSYPEAPVRIISFGPNSTKMGGTERSESPKIPTVHSMRETSPRLMVKDTVIASAAKKQLQYGKSHPLAKLNIKPKHINTVYNTM